MKFFHLSVRLTNEKPDAFVCPFDKPIKSLYFRSLVVSVSFQGHTKIALIYRGLRYIEICYLEVPMHKDVNIQIPSLD